MKNNLYSILFIVIFCGTQSVGAASDEVKTEPDDFQT